MLSTFKRYAGFGGGLWYLLSQYTALCDLECVLNSKERRKMSRFVDQRQKMLKEEVKEVEL